MGYELEPNVRRAMEDAAKGATDYLDELDRIENESYDWGTPNVEIAAAAAKRSCLQLIIAIQNWTGVTTMGESGPVNPYVWLQQIATPDGTFILDAANTATEITEDLFKANTLYHQGDTLKALEQVNAIYQQWGATTVNALIGAMCAQLLTEPAGQQANRTVPSSIAEALSSAAPFVSQVRKDLEAQTAAVDDLGPAPR